MAASGRLSIIWLFALIAGLISPAIAQTWTDCNPLKRDDCKPNPALGMDYTYNFTGLLNAAVWNTTSGKVINGEKGGEFTIRERLQSPTIQSNFYIFFGRLEVHMKAATGQGIVSSVVLQSEDLDEIDWEWVGSEQGHVQTNYFGKGNDTSFDRGKKHEVNDPMHSIHNYTVHWTAEKLEWWVDQQLVRTLKYEEAEGGKFYPQTPATVRLGIWPAGDPGNRKGTIEWAGGEVDYSNGPYTMIVKQLKVEDFHKGKEYVYGDRSGDWKSIKVIEGVSKVAEEASKPPPKSLSEKWNDLSAGAKGGIFTAAGIVVAVFAAVIAFCCVKQRRAGRKEFNMESSKFATEQTSNMALRSQWNHKYQEVRGN
ncbi:hypothetical protein D8B26_007682 [Coccidioides posadasii str. Silveira]|uniref:chitinase n=3 Tax=Coccidioides posadasii TaxID=199306 RepID=E9D2N8_COCPS|nr:Glycosyl hydrolases family 16 protein [Coccidioides posadasii C735 delta SOWgp]EER25083.1 Glycosyl hydrolases family 16 protein [Coccidioides posadasii C735 delta SOWgp]EFW19452.1 cell wall glucanase [Coccidioides posadasii str. Silveira]KMM71914.1 hypothetical protein CPAG_08214 [Coccidioides posadasii RMSCC 3488]QVM13067.1 hypothetical protein D8B26_007682 [Coccidioides posadasii str. Silveira]|eukprot:XP_003067228.1 Glycosyl hydrolases family 16 protein [Coccidioides posadasii C735 delta SOWgp]